MARQTIVRLKDDLDGTEAETTVQFGSDGVTYEIDLSAANATVLRAVLEPYVTAGRRVAAHGRGRRRSAVGASPNRRRASTAKELAAVREWASRNGHQIAARGRIAVSVLEAYRTAQMAAPAGVNGSSSASVAPAAKRAAARKTGATKVAAKKNAARKNAAKKAPAPAKKATSRRVAAAKAAPRKAATRKSAPRKAAAASRRGRAKS